jgi:stage V sporulation protein D (sporulation-specific penicillin-binding protein)
VVGVVVIDEPRGGHYYGGEVAAPVFREVIRDLMRVPDGPLGPGRLQVATRPPAPAPVTVPDLRLLPRATAEQRLDSQGLHARVAGEGARVVGQDPAAGSAVERGAAVTVWLSAPDSSGDQGLPDLVGLSVRAAMRQLNLLQVAVQIVGHGIVVAQDPPPGARLPLGRACVLRCETAARTQASLDGQVDVRLAAARGGDR